MPWWRYRKACSEIQQVMRGLVAELVKHLRDQAGDQPDGKPQRSAESTLGEAARFPGDL